MPKRFTGVLAPVVMPYKDDYTPDARLLIKQCEWLLAQNVGLAVFGTNSEGNSLSTEEKINLIDLLVVAGIDPNQMMPGTGCCALSDSIRLTSHAIEAGCGGVLMLPPFFYKNVTDDGLYGSYSEIIQRVGSSKLRLYLYHIPQVSNVPISLNLIERLLRDYPNTVVGIKDSSGDWENTKAMLDQKWNNFEVFVGSETFLLKNMLHGGAGCISATANVNPEAIYQAFTNWKSENADKVQAELNKVRDLFAKYPVIPALKQCVAHFSEQPSWKRLRPPLIELNEAQTKALINDLQTINFNMPGIK